MTADGTHTDQWDAEGRLRSVDNGNTASYTFNALGWRVEKKVGSAYTEFLYDASGEIVGENNRSIWTYSYVNFQGRHHVIYTNGTTGNTYFTHANSLGSTTQVTDYSGALVQDKLFYPFGQDWAMVGTLYEERFAKLQRRDSETSLDPTPNRMFSSSFGRWMSPDPLPGRVEDPQTLDRYAYVADNPTNRVDPRGDQYCDLSFDPYCGYWGFYWCNPFVDLFCGYYGYCDPFYGCGTRGMYGYAFGFNPELLACQLCMAACRGERAAEIAAAVGSCLSSIPGAVLCYHRFLYIQEQYVICMRRCAKQGLIGLNLAYRRQRHGTRPEATATDRH